MRVYTYILFQHASCARHYAVEYKYYQDKVTKRAATPDGTRVIDLLPGGRRLENAFTKARTEPVNAAVA